MDFDLPHRFEPRWYQSRLMRYFNGGGKRASCVWHRRAGKDRTMLNQCCYMAHRRTGLYWHMLPTLKQGRKVVWDNITGGRPGEPGVGERLIDTVFPRSLIARKIEDEMKLELRCGSIVQIVGSDNYDSYIGSNPLHVTFSEYALTDPRAWDYVRPILRENGGTAAFIFTPRGYNHAYDLHQYAKKNPEWYSETLSIDDTDIITRADMQEDIDSGMPEELARQEYLCDFSAANVGSVVGRWIEEADKSGRLCEFTLYDPSQPVIISSDIGFRDAAAWWFWQAVPGGLLLIDYREESGWDAEDWIEELQRIALEDGYTYERIWLPHDARIKTFQSKHSSVEKFVAAFGAKVINVVPQAAKEDTINAARSVLRYCAFDKQRCARGLMVLRQWQYEWDSERKVFSKEPLHDWASHGGFAFGYGATVLRGFVPKAAGPKPIIVPPADRSFTLDGLWDTAPNAGDHRRIA